MPNPNIEDIIQPNDKRTPEEILEEYRKLQTAYQHSSREVIRGSISGVKSAFLEDIPQIIRHPIDNVIYPVGSLTLDIALLSGLVLPPPSVIEGAVIRMQARITNTKQFFQHFTNASEFEQGEILSRMATSGLAMGYLMQGAAVLGKISKNYYDFGTFRNPPRWFSLYSKEDRMPQTPFFPLEDIKAGKFGTDTFIYVITPDKKLLMAPANSIRPLRGYHHSAWAKKHGGKLRLLHSDLSNGEPVLLGGEVKLLELDGKLDTVVEMNSKSGHFKPVGPQLKKIAEKIFQKHGFEVKGKFKPYLIDRPASIKLAPNVEYAKLTSQLDIPSVLMANSMLQITSSLGRPSHHLIYQNLEFSFNSKLIHGGLTLTNLNREVGFFYDPLVFDPTNVLDASDFTGFSVPYDRSLAHEVVAQTIKNFRSKSIAEKMGYGRLRFSLDVVENAMARAKADNTRAGYQSAGLFLKTLAEENITQLQATRRTAGHFDATLNDKFSHLAKSFSHLKNSVGDLQINLHDVNQMLGEVRGQMHDLQKDHARIEVVTEQLFKEMVKTSVEGFERYDAVMALKTELDQQVKNYESLKKADPHSPDLSVQMQSILGTRNRLSDAQIKIRENNDKFDGLMNDLRIGANWLSQIVSSVDGEAGVVFGALLQSTVTIATGMGALAGLGGAALSGSMLGPPGMIIAGLIGFLTAGQQSNAFEALAKYVNQLIERAVAHIDQRFDEQSKLIIKTHLNVLQELVKSNRGIQNLQEWVAQVKAQTNRIEQKIDQGNKMAILRPYRKMCDHIYERAFTFPNDPIPREKLIEYYFKLSSFVTQESRGPEMAGTAHEGSYYENFPLEYFNEPNSYINEFADYAAKNGVSIPQGPLANPDVYAEGVHHYLNFLMSFPDIDVLTTGIRNHIQEKIKLGETLKSLRISFRTSHSLIDNLFQHYYAGVNDALKQYGSRLRDNIIFTDSNRDTLLRDFGFDDAARKKLSDMSCRTLEGMDETVPIFGSSPADHEARTKLQTGLLAKLSHLPLAPAEWVATLRKLAKLKVEPESIRAALQESKSQLEKALLWETKKYCFNVKGHKNDGLILYAPSQKDGFWKTVLGITRNMVLGLGVPGAMQLTAQEWIYKSTGCPDVLDHNDNRKLLEKSGDKFSHLYTLDKEQCLVTGLDRYFALHTEEQENLKKAQAFLVNTDRIAINGTYSSSAADNFFRNLEPQTAGDYNDILIQTLSHNEINQYPINLHAKFLKYFLDQGFINGKHHIDPAVGQCVSMVIKDGPTFSQFIKSLVESNPQQVFMTAMEPWVQELQRCYQLFSGLVDNETKGQFGDNKLHDVERELKKNNTPGAALILENLSEDEIHLADQFRNSANFPGVDEAVNRLRMFQNIFFSRESEQPLLDLALQIPDPDTRREVVSTMINKGLLETAQPQEVFETLQTCPVTEAAVKAFGKFCEHETELKGGDKCLPRIPVPITFSDLEPHVMLGKVYWHLGKQLGSALTKWWVGASDLPIIPQETVYGGDQLSVRLGIYKKWLAALEKIIELTKYSEHPCLHQKQFGATYKKLMHWYKISIQNYQEDTDEMCLAPRATESQLHELYLDIHALYHLMLTDVRPPHAYYPLLPAFKGHWKEAISAAKRIKSMVCNLPKVYQDIMTHFVTWFKNLKKAALHIDRLSIYFPNRNDKKDLDHLHWRLAHCEERINKMTKGIFTKSITLRGFL